MRQTAAEIAIESPIVYGESELDQIIVWNTSYQLRLFQGDNSGNYEEVDIRTMSEQPKDIHAAIDEAETWVLDMEGEDEEDEEDEDY